MEKLLYYLCGNHRYQRSKCLQCAIQNLQLAGITNRNAIRLHDYTLTVYHSAHFQYV